jgi:hypothetical protein
MPEGGLPKPTDVFIGIIDFFAVLVPGVVGVIVVGWVVSFQIPEKQDVFFLGAILLD